MFDKIKIIKITWVHQILKLKIKKYNDIIIILNFSLRHSCYNLGANETHNIQMSNVTI